MEIHPKKVFENAFQIQILIKYTSLVLATSFGVSAVSWSMSQPRMAVLDR
jgi:hypothetical protein